MFATVPDDNPARPLPVRFAGGLRAVYRALVYDVPPESLETDVKDRSKEKEEFAYPKAVHLSIYCYDILGAEIAEALAAGEVSEEGLVAGKYKVYALEDSMNRESVYFFAPTPDIILTADDKDMLSAMYTAGTGLDLSITDTEDFADVREYIPHECRSWFVTCYTSQEKIWNDLMIRNHWSDEQMEEVRQNIAAQPTFTIDRAAIDEDENFEFQRTIIYRSSEVAKKAGESSEIRAFPVKGDDEIAVALRRALDERMKIIIEDNVVVQTVVYDDEVLRLRREYGNTRKAATAEEIKAAQEEIKKKLQEKKK